MPYVDERGQTHYTKEDHAEQRRVFFMKRLLPQDEADGIRSLPAGDWSARFHCDRLAAWDEQGVLKIATGRSRCRCCGEKIRRGDYAVKFVYDFNGCGPWTAVDCWMHAEHCESRYSGWGFKGDGSPTPMPPVPEMKPKGEHGEDALVMVCNCDPSVEIYPKLESQSGIAFAVWKCESCLTESSQSIGEIDAHKARRD